MNTYFWEKNQTSAVRDIQFTEIAEKNIRKIISSEDFEEMDAEMIYEALLLQLDAIPFCDYLKRYLYERAEIREAFWDVPDEVYREIIMEAFSENQTPHFFTPTTAKWGSTVKRWLEQDSVNRSVIFLLGFGLGMEREDVSGFLIKAILESDFRPDHPEEVIFRYCFQNHLPYAKAKAYLDWYSHREGTAPEERDSVSGEPSNEQQLLARLQLLKGRGNAEGQGEIKQKEFLRLYKECQLLIARLYTDDELIRSGKKEWLPDEIGPADLEKILCDGIPVTGNGNLQKMTLSHLGRKFRQKRITRQRLDSLLKGEKEIERHDLITLQFLLSSQDEEEDPRVRCRRFWDRINPVLAACGMMGMYPANPYEAFILLCLMSDTPLLTWYSVWEKSYES